MLNKSENIFIGLEVKRKSRLLIEQVFLIKKSAQNNKSCAQKKKIIQFFYVLIDYFFNWFLGNKKIYLLENYDECPFCAYFSPHFIIKSMNK